MYGRAADERLGRQAIWNVILKIRLRCFVVISLFILNREEKTYLEWNVAYHPIRCQWSRIRDERLPRLWWQDL
jgi:hypothetical protein